LKCTGPIPDKSPERKDDSLKTQVLEAPGSTASFTEITDEEVVSYAKNGDELATEYVINKYKNFVRVKAKSYFLVGADREDIIQEGMIGLYKAIRDFKADKLSSFRAFAELCITRQIITAIKTATRQKHIPLNSYISLNKPIYDDDSDRTMMDILSGVKITDPEEVFINHELSGDIREKIQENLSELESLVLASYLEGKSYQEMARELNRHVKSIDNALQRVKRKIEKSLTDVDL
jgi:RNA polymerase sporulation-specific sigma factor